MKRDFKGVWIPKEIWLDENLTWMEKLFITEIWSLERNGECFASNNYFAKFFHLSASRCSHIINEIISKGYIEAKYEKTGKKIDKRVLRIRNRGIADLAIGYCGFSEGINTSINNTYTSTKDTIEPSAQGFKDSLLGKIEEIFLSHLPDTSMWDYGLQRKALKKLGQRGSANLTKIVNHFWKLKTSNDKFWKKQPFLPSVLNSKGIWPMVVESYSKAPKPQKVKKMKVCPKCGAEYLFDGCKQCGWRENV